MTPHLNPEFRDFCDRHGLMPRHLYRETLIYRTAWKVYRGHRRPDVDTAVALVRALRAALRARGQSVPRSLTVEALFPPESRRARGSSAQNISPSGDARKERGARTRPEDTPLTPQAQPGARDSSPRASRRGGGNGKGATAPNPLPKPGGGR